MNQLRLQHILDTASRKRILVVGDVMLDEFVWGNAGRISTEAPVLIVNIEKESSYPGGAANVARNLREFTPLVTIMGMIGKDIAGEKLTNLLHAEGIATHGLLTDTKIPTIVKTRIIAQRQQIVRVDKEQRSRAGSQLDNIVLNAKKLIPQSDAILMEDYGKGFLDQRFVDVILQIASEYKVLVTCDPNPKNPIDWSGVGAIKPNRCEAFAYAGVPLSPPVYPVENDKALLQVGEILLSRWSTPSLLITLNEQGMILFRPSHPPYYTPTRAREIYDVSGAGDTSISLYTLGIVGGATPEEAAEFANHAAGVVVGKLGTATCSRIELETSLLNSLHNE